ncbi:hypothetical protein [Mammaliicoccus sciuri]|uniref:hypothetical protein n=1 Tax=Mammaliicoccus sciuri TaxID=1296 RepID=UPI002B261F9D|nr:hypothetical protein [Mammaliicoccus sciuri]WQK75191.1 hypothetical protein P3U33_05535 [Mammaliicoccus sciuri]
MLDLTKDNQVKMFVMYKNNAPLLVETDKVSFIHQAKGILFWQLINDELKGVLEIDERINLHDKINNIKSVDTLFELVNDYGYKFKSKYVDVLA